MTRLILDIDNSSLYGQIGTPTNIKVKDKVLHLGDVVKLNKGTRNKEGIGVVMLWGHVVIISGYGLIPIKELELDDIICSHESSTEELNEYYIDRDMVVADMKYVGKRG